MPNTAKPRVKIMWTVCQIKREKIEERKRRTLIVPEKTPLNGAQNKKHYKKIQ